MVHKTCAFVNASTYALLGFLSVCRCLNCASFAMAFSRTTRCKQAVLNTVARATH